MTTGLRVVTMCTLALLVSGASFALSIPAAEDPGDGAALLAQMYDRYKNNWYDTLTFKQKSTTHKPDGADSSEIWYEAALLPGKLRIDKGDLNAGNGLLVADGKLTTFENGKEASSRAFVHMLLVLGFDVYRQPVETTIAQVKGEGFDLTKLHEDTWEGQPVYVVGADKGDLNSKQFWIEKKRLLFVRLLQPSTNDKTKISESRFLDYRKLSSGWVAARVEFYFDGKNVFSEEYSEIQENLKLDPAVFDPAQFSSKHWEK
ncbi:MAG TPA: hypothetical protein VE077_09435 [Candidatus Methylomirabilis sp.]|nr:hypothetical protein [Candidatus Methylomirabilis sp.]